MIGDEYEFDSAARKWRMIKPGHKPTFLREPTREDLRFVKPQAWLAFMPEPRHYRRALDRRREVTTAELLGLLAFAMAIGFCLGAYCYA